MGWTFVGVAEGVAADYAAAVVVVVVVASGDESAAFEGLLSGLDSELLV